MSKESLIVVNPDIMCGKPVVKGTRITVEFILESLSNGVTPEDLLREHPTLTREGIQAALSYAVGSVRNELVFSLGKKAA